MSKQAKGGPDLSWCKDVYRVNRRVINKVTNIGLLREKTVAKSLNVGLNMKVYKAHVCIFYLVLHQEKIYLHVLG